MKLNFSTSEKFFLSLGTGILVAGLTLVYTEFSLTDFWMPASSTDPFAASYSFGSSPNPTLPSPSDLPVEKASPPALPSVQPLASPRISPSVAASTPASTPAKKTKASPTPDPLRPKEQAYLLVPKAYALFNQTRVLEKPLSLTFKFEVDPKKTPCTFVLDFQGKTILTKNLRGSPTGTFQLKVKITQPGQYHWQILTEKSKSEKRGFSIKN